MAIITNSNNYYKNDILEYNYFSAIITANNFLSEYINRFCRMNKCPKLKGNYVEKQWGRRQLVTLFVNLRKFSTLSLYSCRDINY